MAVVVRPQTGTVALYVDLMREHARQTAVTVARTLRAAGFDVAFCDDQERALGISSEGASFQNAILLITIGGDGTLLRAARIAAPLSIPLFGINTGRLGFLTEMDGAPDQLDRLPEIVRAGFTIDERTALRAEVHGKQHFALNDIVVRRTTPHMMPFGLFINGKEAAFVPADGIAVATPTGSTAYSLSAGGPILAPDVAALGVVALLPHTLFSRPLVVPDTAHIELVFDAESHVVDLEADGMKVDDLYPGDRVVVTRYPLQVLFARRAPLDFFTLLEWKLRWNAPLKDRSTT
ncbi:MAG: NAD(+)/NADH kinase [Vulcanimicrobiaceae bacterium]